MKKYRFVAVILLFAMCMPLLTACGERYTVEYVNVENGSIIGECEQSVFSGKAAKSVTAVPNSGYIFVAWSDGISIPTRSDSNITGNISVYPIFSPENYVITYRGECEGEELFSYDISRHYTEKTLFITNGLHRGYEFLAWDDGNTSPSRQDTYMWHGKTVTAHFAKKHIGTPEIRITTEGNQKITSKETYINCSFSLSCDFPDYDMKNLSAQIRGRGNSTWDSHEKKSYRVKFNEKQSMLGTDYKAKSWVLIANHADKSLSRNALAYEMAEQFDYIEFSSVHYFVEVYLNNEYMGLYLLCDQVQEGNGRVELSDDFSDPEDMSFFVEIDARAHSEGTVDIDYFIFSGDKNREYAMKYPEPDSLGYDPDMLEFARWYLSLSMEAIDAKDWDTTQKYVDVESFADVYLIQELFANLDCHSYSFYMYRDKGGRLTCGPVWDFDISSGNNNYGMGDGYECKPDHDLVNQDSLWATKNTWFRRLLRIPEFKLIVERKLVEYEDTIMQVFDLVNVESTNRFSYYNLHKEQMNKNFKRWDIMGKYVWPEPQVLIDITTVEGQLKYLYDWLLARYKIVSEYYGVYESGKE